MRQKVTLWLSSSAIGEERELTGWCLLTDRSLTLWYFQPLEESDLNESEKEMLSLWFDTSGKVSKVQMSRPKTGLTMAFAEGKRNESSLLTPAGKIDVAIQTNRLEGRVTPKGADLILQYELWLGGAFQEEVTLTVKARYESETYGLSGKEKK